MLERIDPSKREKGRLRSRTRLRRQHRYHNASGIRRFRERGPHRNKRLSDSRSSPGSSPPGPCRMSNSIRCTRRRTTRNAIRSGPPRRRSTHGGTCTFSTWPDALTGTGNTQAADVIQQVRAFCTKERLRNHGCVLTKPPILHCAASGFIILLRHEHELRVCLDPEFRSILTQLLDSGRHPGDDGLLQPLPQ